MTTERVLERAKLFRARAAELREIAPTMKDSAAGVQLLQMALTYDTLAIRLEGSANDGAPAAVGSPSDELKAER